MPHTPPHTPDGRYFVVRGRLWRATNPSLPQSTQEALVHTLMDARRQVGAAKRTNNAEAMKQARLAVDTAKIALGERGGVWWTDDAPDHNRKLVKNTPYSAWYGALKDDGKTT